MILEVIRDEELAGAVESEKHVGKLDRHRPAAVRYRDGNLEVTHGLRFSELQADQGLFKVSFVGSCNRVRGTTSSKEASQPS